MTARSLQGREPFVAWPGMASLRITLPLSYLFFKIFSSVYGGASLLAKLRRPHADFYFPWEMRLPFVPAAALVYLTVPLLLLLTPFILRTWRQFMPFFLTLTVETLIAGLFFLTMPLAQAYPQREADGFFGGVFALTDRLNLDYNKFPSLLIAFAVTAAIVFGRRCGWLGRSLFALWIVAVAASTMLIHEHQILDLAGGLVLGLACVATVQRRAADERYLGTLRIEALCLREIWRLGRVRSLRAYLALFRASRFRWRQTRPLRVAYCLVQHVNGALSGDPEERGRAILRVLAGGVPSPAPAEQLAAFLAAELEDGRKRELSEQIAALIEGGRQVSWVPLPFPSAAAGTAPGPPRSAASR